MSGHRWHSILSLSLVAVLAGCQTDGSGKYAWNPFLKNADQSDPAREDSSFSLPKFASRKADDTPESGTSATSPMAAEQMERLLEQGQLALQDNRLDDARKAYSEVLGSSPDNATAHHGMAMAADLSQQWRDAEYHYRQALRIRPRDANLLCDIGYSYLLQNRYSEASRYLNHAVEVNSQHESAQMNLALLDLRQGNRTAAEQRINERFGSSAKASQILAQLETQAGKTIDESASERSVIPANATLEQIQEIAARERLEAERRRRMQGIPQEPPILALDNTLQPGGPGQQPLQHQVLQESGFDPRTGMPFTQHSGANPQGQSAAMAQHGMAQQSTGIMANYGDAGPVSAMSSEGMQNPQPWASAPAGTITQEYQQPSSMTAVTNPGISNASPPVTYGTNGAAINAVAAGPGRPAGMTSPVSSSMTPGANIAPSTAATPNNGASLGRVIPVHSSGAFPPPSTNSISYGQPVGFGGAAGQSPVNSASVSNSVPMSPNGGTMGTQINPNPAMTPGLNPQNPSGTNSAQQMYLEGLNAGPGALFPIGQAPSNQSIAPAQFQNGLTGSAAGPNSSLGMGNISSPGTNSMINGAMYEQPQNAIPAQEWLNQQQQQLLQQQQRLQLQLQQTQRPQGSMMPQSGAGRQESVSAAWPSARPPQSNPLEVYDRQRQQLDNEYNNTLQQMDRQNPAARNFQ